MNHITWYIKKHSIYNEYKIKNTFIYTAKIPPECK